MKQTCPECKSIIEIDESKYSGGEKVTKVCPLCETEVIFAIPEVEKEEVKSTEPQIVERVVEKIIIQEAAPVQTAQHGSGISTGTLVGVIVGLLVLAGAVGGYFYYNNTYLPEKIDREAPRYYTFANSVVLRSSKSSGADFNKVASLPYGSELITYQHDPEWSQVKVNSVSADGKKPQGYVASPFIMNKNDFYLFNSIWGDVDSKEVIATSKCRIALLNYFKERGYIGKITNEMLNEAGIHIKPNSENQWQVFSKPANSKYNNEYFKRLYDKDSKFTDFAVIIQNISTNERRLLYFYFDDDETPHLAAELNAPYTGSIKKITIVESDGKRYLNVDYTE